MRAGGGHHPLDLVVRVTRGGGRGRSRAEGRKGPGEGGGGEAGTGVGGSIAKGSGCLRKDAGRAWVSPAQLGGVRSGLFEVAA